MSFKSLFMSLVPRGAVLLLARVVRLYTLWSPLAAGKRAMITGRSVFRLFDLYEIEAEVTTRPGTRMRVRFPDMSQKSIFFCGFREPAITAFICQSLKRGDVFVDVGANIGYHSCIAAMLTGPGGEVHAIEPSPRLLGVMEANLRLNGAENVRLHNVAIMDREGTATVFLGPQRSLGRTTILERDAGSRFSEEAEVRGMPLHRAIAPRSLYRARLIKIDVEGSEWQVLRAVFDRLPRFEPTTEWIIEITPSVARREGGSITEIIAGFARAGYRAYRLENRFDVDWYLRRGRAILEEDLDELVQSLPEDPESVPQLDVLFSHAEYGRPTIRTDT